MRRAIAAAAAAALVAVGVTAQAGTSTRDASARCVVNGAETLVANEDVRVYTLDRPSANDTQRAAIYACLHRTGQRRALGVAATKLSDDEDPAPVHYIRSVRITPDYGDGAAVAWVDTDCTKDPCRQRVIVRSLRTGRTVFRLPAGSGFDRLALSEPTDQAGFALAWLETSPGGDCASGCRVHLVKGSGDRVLDEGTDIDPDRFGELLTDAPGIVAFGGSNEFVWQRGGVMKVASFND